MVRDRFCKAASKDIAGSSPVTSFMEILIPTHPKDYNKLPYVVSSCANIKSNWASNTYVVSPTEIPADIKSRIIGDVKYLLDDEVIPNFDRSKIPYRPNWIFQQLIKLTQEVTGPEYLCVDSDLIFNRPISFYEDNKRLFLLGQDQNHQPYFNWQEKFAGLGKVYGHSFINEVMLFDRDLLSTFFREIGINNMAEAREKIVSYISKDAYPSEFEFFGSVVEKRFPERYNKRHAKTVQLGRTVAQYGENAFSQNDIENAIRFYRDKDVDWFTLHTWS